MTELSYDVLNPKCPTQQVLDRVASKWMMLVILALGDDRVHYAQLQRRVRGITKKMLTQTLRALERDGLVCRHVHHTVPPQTEYELTSLGHGLAAVVSVVRSWAYQNVEDIAQARSTYDSGEHSAPLP